MILMFLGWKQIRTTSSRKEKVAVNEQKQYVFLNVLLCCLLELRTALFLFYLFLFLFFVFLFPLLINNSTHTRHTCACACVYDLFQILYEKQNCSTGNNYFQPNLGNSWCFFVFCFFTVGGGYTEFLKFERCTWNWI